MRDIHKVGWIVVSMLRIQAEDKAKESKVQGKIAGKKK
jgi:hypothetical protein